MTGPRGAGPWPKKLSILPEKRNEIGIAWGTWRGEGVVFRTGRVVITVKVEARRLDPERVSAIAKRLAEQVPGAQVVREDLVDATAR